MILDLSQYLNPPSLHTLNKGTENRQRRRGLGSPLGRPSGVPPPPQLFHHCF